MQEGLDAGGAGCGDRRYGARDHCALADGRAAKAQAHALGWCTHCVELLAIYLFIVRASKLRAMAEARGGLHIVEQSLWAAIPTYLRRVNAAVKKHTGRELPIDVRR